MSRAICSVLVLIVATSIGCDRMLQAYGCTIPCDLFAQAFEGDAGHDRWQMGYVKKHCYTISNFPTGF